MTDDDREDSAAKKVEIFTPPFPSLWLWQHTSMHMDNISYCLIKSLNDEFPFFYGRPRRRVLRSM